jgi:hypothetical protein
MGTTKRRLFLLSNFGGVAFYNAVELQQMLRGQKKAQDLLYNAQQLPKRLIQWLKSYKTCRLM